MSNGRKRNRNRGGGGGGGGPKGGPPPKAQNQGGGQNRRRRGNNRNRNKAKRDETSDEVAFWGVASALPEPRQDVRMTDRAAAVPKSLGPPPLPGHEQVAEHYFGVVYDRAVMTAGALAAAGGLIDADALTAHDDED